MSENEKMVPEEVPCGYRKLWIKTLDEKDSKIRELEDIVSMLQSGVSTKHYLLDQMRRIATFESQLGEAQKKIQYYASALNADENERYEKFVEMGRKLKEAQKKIQYCESAMNTDIALRSRLTASGELIEELKDTLNFAYHTIVYNDSAHKECAEKIKQALIKAEEWGAKNK